MKKTMKSCLAAFLCLLMLASLCTAAFADDVAAAAETPEESTGIIDSASLTATVEAYLKENGLIGNNKVFSIGYCYTGTGDCWYYDADQWCYSASLYKVPCCMLLAEKELNGEITADTQINSQYANGTVDYMEQRSIVYSDNYTGHAVVEYLGGTYQGKCAEQTIKFTDLPEDYFSPDFAAYSYYSARYFNKVLQELYTNSANYPRIMDYMKQDQTYHYLDLQLNGQYETAQKYGAFEEKNGNKNYHSAGIIYTPNPIIVTIMTKNITGFEKHIGNVAKILVDYTVQLDGELATYKANQLIAQQEEQARIAREEQERLAAEAAAQQQAAVQSAQTVPAAQNGSAPADSSANSLFIDTPIQPAVSDSGESGSLLDGLLGGSLTGGNMPSFVLPVIIGLAVLALIFLIVFIIKLRNAKLDEEEYGDEDYEEYMRGDLSELAPKQDKKSRRAERKKKKSDEYDEYGEYDEYDGYDGRNGRKTSSAAKSDRYADDGYDDRYADDRYNDQYNDRYDGQYDDGQYDDGQYDDSQYDDGRYDDGQYDDGQYDDGRYDDGQYDDGGYDDSQYGDSYAGSYRDDDRVGTYDEEPYDNGQYVQDEGEYRDSGYEEKVSSGRFDDRYDDLYGETEPDDGYGYDNYDADDRYADMSGNDRPTKDGYVPYDDGSGRKRRGRSSSGVSGRMEKLQETGNAIKGLFGRKKAQAVQYDEYDDGYGRESYAASQTNKGRGAEDYADIPEEDFSRYGLGRGFDEEEADPYGTVNEYADEDYSLSEFDYNDQEFLQDDDLFDDPSDRYSPRH